MIKMQHDVIDPAAWINDARIPGAGAIVTFIGIVRDDNIESIDLKPTRKPQRRISGK